MSTYQNSGGGTFTNQTGLIGGAIQGDHDDSSRNDQPVRYITPVTIKQILESDQIENEDKHLIDSRIVGSCIIVGRIEQVIEAEQTHLEYGIEDGTGSIKVRMFLDPEDGAAEYDYIREKAADWQEGAYIITMGKISKFNNSVKFITSKIRTITDFNELTHHYLSAIHCHKVHTSESSSTGTNQTAQPNQNYARTTSLPTAKYTPGGSDDVFDDLQRMILDAFRTADKHYGMHKEQVVRQLEDVGDANSIREGIEFLFSEGHLYQTSDPNHLATTMQ
eukprot:TRINITY_DN11851_c0_g1_i1.p1 TRINITY_DN11851_c0_g1~~TRINITY_DN11851_c0_g1_i1.p1  ORF type:complete len:277 (-),score=70.83 TRINITY_DN11851_c0_g1_i1:46-876(-)